MRKLIIIFTMCMVYTCGYSQLPSFVDWTKVSFTIKGSPQFDLSAYDKIVIGNVYNNYGKVDNASADIVNEFTNIIAKKQSPEIYSRSNIGDVLDELEFQSSGLVDEASISRIGKFIGSGVILIGKVIQHDDVFSTKKWKSILSDCSYNYKGRLTYSLIINLQLIDIQTAKVIYSENIDGTAVEYVESDCSPPKRISGELVYPEALTKLGRAFNNTFFHHENNVTVAFDSHSQFKKELRSALALLKINDTESAYSIIYEIAQRDDLKDKAKSSALYNLGLLQFYSGAFDLCQESMKQAFILNDRCEQCLNYLD